MDVNTRRKLTDQSIAINPTEIVVSRYSKVSDGAGGYNEGWNDLPAQTFRLYLSNQTVHRVENEAGTLETKAWEMLCPWDADIKVEDKFTFDGQQYHVAVVNPVRYKGEIVSYQCVVQEVV